MKIAYIAAGAGGMYCGSCIHDNTVAAALQDLGHEVALLPTYTPMRTDEASVSEKRVFYGALGVYLEQKSAFFRRRHRALDWILNRPGLLEFVARFSGRTDARELGELALGVLRGEAGTATKELDQLVAFLKQDFRPDLVHVTNSLFLGLVRRLRSELGVPVVVAVQGEDLFLDELPEAYRHEVVAEMRRRAADVSAFLAPNHYYAGHMAELLEVPVDRMTVIPLGLNLDGHSEPLERPGDDAPRTVGYLARIAPEKGLHHLVEAFLELARDPDLEDVRLAVAGYLGPKDRSYYLELERKIAAAGLIDRYDYVGEIDRAAKISFLRSLDVVAVPTVYREAKGLFALEAMANGVPVVVPDHGGFPEMLAATGGGCLVEPGSQRDLADTVRRLLRDRDERRALGDAARQAVLERFGAEAMARATADFYKATIARTASSRPSGAPAGPAAETAREPTREPAEPAEPGPP